MGGGTEPSIQQLICKDSNRPQVDTKAVAGPSDGFRGEVFWSSAECGAWCVRGGTEDGTSKVSHSECAITCDQNILWLQVPMNDIPRVHVCHCCCDREGIVSADCFRHFPALSCNQSEELAIGKVVQDEGHSLLVVKIANGVVNASNETEKLPEQSHDVPVGEPALDLDFSPEGVHTVRVN
jgi:hypothetical protein